MPTENRSSNTEMVSLSRDLIDLTLAHLPNDSAAKWELHEVLARPAPQPHPEPIAWMVGTAFWWTKEEAERDAEATGLPIVGLGPMTYSAEVERLSAALKFYADREHYHFESGNWDTVSGEPLNILWCGDEPDFIEDGTVARAALERQP
ncbi:hypothetical protein ACFW6U_10100 [Pseudomonas guariconensis]|uniref:hypothetical protein n=1 Tax=Pseudomonas guariconensis TaxID=1288410 RepID=UPI0036720F0D